MSDIHSCQDRRAKSNQIETVVAIIEKRQLHLLNLMSFFWIEMGTIMKCEIFFCLLEVRGFNAISFHIHTFGF